MITAGDFRNGITIEMDNNIYQIIEFQHVKPGKGAAFVRTKLKSITGNGVIITTISLPSSLSMISTLIILSSSDISGIL